MAEEKTNLTAKLASLQTSLLKSNWWRKNWRWLGRQGWKLPFTILSRLFYLFIYHDWNGLKLPILTNLILWTYLGLIYEDVPDKGVDDQTVSCYVCFVPLSMVTEMDEDCRALLP